MHIGMVCPYDIGKPGGVQQLSGELARQLRSAGDQVTFVAAGRSWFYGGPGLDEVTVPAGRGVSIRANQSKVPLTLSPTRWRQVRRALESVDVIHVHEPLIPLVGWMALSVDRPTVATFHADAPDWVARLYRWAPFVGRRMRRAIITAVSETARSVIPEAWGRINIVPNAIDVASYDVPVGRIKDRVIFLGRDDPRKGLDVLLRAWPRVLEAVPDAGLVVVGTDNGRSIPGVSFRGRVSEGEKKRLLASSAIYVAPNLGGESFGIVVTEAMAAGCAVIVSDLPAFRDVIGPAGVRTPVGDDRRLADAMTDLLGDPRRAAELQSSARSRVERYDWATVAAEYRALYQTLVE